MSAKTFVEFVRPHNFGGQLYQVGDKVSVNAVTASLLKKSGAVKFIKTSKGAKDSAS